MLLLLPLIHAETGHLVVQNLTGQNIDRQK